MKLLRGLHNTPVLEQGCVATIGNFDGVHLGHQQMLVELNHKAQALGLPLVVLLFEPQPKEFFMQQAAPARLSRLRDKVSFLNLYGVNNIVCLRFDEHLASLSPQTFIDKVLLERLNVKYLMVGEDFRFGAKRAGDYAYLSEYLASKQCEVEAIPVVTLDDARVSSTRVRQALKDGDLILTKRLLGRDFSMFGRVAHGDKRGREWGIPTANVYLHRLVSPIQGVFCVQVVGIGSRLINGVANVGNRPTVCGTKSLLEVHLLDFDEEIYGKNIEVRFIKKLRSEQQFDSIDELKQQIFTDIDKAVHFFTSL